MNRKKAVHLEIGYQVRLSNSNVHASGVVVEDLGTDYVRVQWLDSRSATTHRRYALRFERVTSFREWSALILGAA
jgi:hypothetical protein